MIEDVFLLYQLAWNRFIHHPIFGDGIKSSKYMIAHYLEGGYVSHYHNFILQIAATLGVVGLLLFSMIVLKWIKILWKPKDVFVICAMVSIIGGLTHQMLDVSFDLFYFGLIFYTILGVVEIYRVNLKEDSLEMKIIKIKLFIIILINS